MPNKMIKTILLILAVSFFCALCKRSDQRNQEMPKSQGSFDTAYDLLKKGEDQLGHGDYEGAILSFTWAIDLKPDYAEAYTDRGSAHLLNLDPKEAVNDFNSAIKLNPKEALAYAGRADSLTFLHELKYRDQDSLAEALADYKKALKLGLKGDMLPAVYCNMGLTKIRLGKVREGCRDLKKSKELGLSKADIFLEQHCRE